MAGYADYDREKLPLEWVEIAPDIVLVPLWSERLCRRIIRDAEARGDWRPYERDVEEDAAPGQEIRLNLISADLCRRFHRHLVDEIYPLVKSIWWPVTLGGPRMPFVIRCSPDTQAGLDFHHDSSEVSMSVRLNADYEGGALYFPRQRWRNSVCRVGEAVLFPSSVTHAHGIEPVTRGCRYGLTAWLPRKGWKDDLMMPGQDG